MQGAQTPSEQGMECPHPVISSGGEAGSGASAELVMSVLMEKIYNDYFVNQTFSNFRGM